MEVEYTSQEAKAFFATVQTDPPQIFALGWCQDYPDANNFLKDVFHSGSLQNATGWSNPEYDKLVDQAALETDVAKRQALYAQAEEILVKADAAVIPLNWGTSPGVTQPYVQRTYSVTAIEHYEKWDINP